MADIEKKAGLTQTDPEHSIQIITELDEKIDQLALKCQALWEIVRSETSLSDSDIKTKIHEIDMRDGVSDGKITKSERHCNSCGHAVGKRYVRCLYCGKPIEGKEVFDGWGNQ